MAGVYSVEPGRPFGNFPIAVQLAIEFDDFGNRLRIVQLGERQAEPLVPLFPVPFWVKELIMRR